MPVADFSRLRGAVVNAATEIAKEDTPPADATGKVEDMIGEFHGKFQLLGLPIGWTAAGNGWLYKVLGLLITSIAVTLGAPFWYQKLKTIVTMRKAGTATA